MFQFLFPTKPGETNHSQSLLFRLAAAFLICYSVILTLSPSVRQHSWQVDYLWTHWIGFLLWAVGFSMIYRKLVKLEIKADPLILPIIALLIGWGLLSIFRISIYFGLRQTIWMILGIALLYFGLGWKTLLLTLYRYKYLWITLGIFLMALTLIFGTYPGGIGPELWLGGYGLYFQPSEILKVLVIVYLAAYLSSFSAVNLTNARLLLPTLFIIGIASGILVYQRDLGTASIILLVYILFLYMATQKRRMLIFGGISMGVAILTGYSLFSVIRVRLSAWMNPWQDAANSAFQIIQSLISAASGGIFGSGPGIGNPSLVPVAHSDFIFSSILEETGLIGGTVMIVLFMVLLHRVIKIALAASSPYQKMLAAGLIVYLTVQSLLIMGGNLRLFPLTGVTLPFVSYGGSSLLSSMFAVLIWIQIDANQTAPIKTTQLPVRSTLIVESGLLILLSVLWVFALRWGVFQAQSLVQRADNPRNALADSYVPRGNILDRNHKILVETVGEPGFLERQLTSPALIQLTGYSNLTYGQSNLESSLNNYLRGMTANRSSEIFWHQLLYSQHPEGLNVRLTIDLDIQNYVDNLLEGHTGAIILMNPINGEILSLSSYPYVKAKDGDLVTAISEQFNDPNLPLINRAVHGLYPPGSAIDPFLYGWATAQNKFIELPEDSQELCLIQSMDRTRWADLFKAGCDSPYNALSQSVSQNEWGKLLSAYHFLDEPEFPLTQAELPPFNMVDTRKGLAISELPLITPLQMAVAASVFSNPGTLASPVLSYAVETPHQGWIILPKTQSVSVDELSTTNSGDLLVKDQGNFWSFLGKGDRTEGPVIWYVSGTTPYWNGMPMMVVVLLEENSPSTAQQIGEEVLFRALNLK
jgi:cell division protein FtsW (lipid II flippase)